MREGSVVTSMGDVNFPRIHAIWSGGTLASASGLTQAPGDSDRSPLSKGEVLRGEESMGPRSYGTLADGELRLRRISRDGVSYTCVWSKFRSAVANGYYLPRV